MQRQRMRLVGALVGVVALCVACEPGWTNPVLGTGDGSGTTPGSVAVANGSVALAKPTSTVDLGAKGFLTYDATTCRIYLTAHGSTTLFAGNGTCGDTGDGGPASQASIDVVNTPLGMGLQADPNGNVYFVSSHANGAVRRIDGATATITTLGATIHDNGFIVGGSAEAGGELTYLLDMSGSDSSNNDQLRRVDADGTDHLIATYSDPEAAVPTGFARVGTDHYVMSVPYSEGANELVSFDDGTVSTTPISVPPGRSIDYFFVSSAGPDGNLYGFTGKDSDSSPILGNFVFRMKLDGSVELIAGSATPDPGDGRQQGQAAGLDLSAQAVSLTHNGNLLITSGHVVYDLAGAADAPVIPLPS